MSTYDTFFDYIWTGDQRKFEVNFGELLPTGASAVSGSASYSQTYGGAASGTVAAVVNGGSTLAFTTAAPSLPGYYWYVARATFSDGQARVVGAWGLTCNERPA